MSNQQNCIKYGNIDIQYEIKRGRRRRKSIAIAVEPNTKVMVLAPKFISENAIEPVVKKHALWIIKKQEYFKKLAQQFPKKEFVNGEKFYFLGRGYRLEIKKEEGQEVSQCNITGRKLIVTINKNTDPQQSREIVKDTLLKWYTDIAVVKIKERVERYSPQMGVNPKKIKIKQQKRRWGSCSISGALNFNWKIVMAPISVLDYIVVHELCHLKVNNHSSGFWNAVSSILPGYQKCREWLKNNSPILNI